ncbi:putative ABC-type xenobiotic transporter [Helianthus debilis subsp. tardiflorus]
MFQGNGGLLLQRREPFRREPFRLLFRFGTAPDILAKTKDDQYHFWPAEVTKNGENWSVGQRQPVCLGGMLLKKSKVLVLDEATALLELATDGMIQQTLAKHFTDSTVIMIAHRIGITYVLDSDMVLVLEQGLIKEYDSPTKLLEDKSSSFAKLVAGYSMRSSSSYENLAAT